MRHTIIIQRINGDNLERHLKELLTDSSVKRCRALIAFVTLDGLLKLGTDPEGPLFKFVKSPNKQFEWIIGVDSITTPDALREIQRLTESANAKCYVKAFSSSEGRLFHPKVYIFERKDGLSTVLIGSSNLTPGGLSENIEVVVRLDDLTSADMDQWSELWESCVRQADIKTINDELLSRVELRHRGERQRRRARLRPPRVVEEIEAPSIRPKILVRYIPRAGGRTSQVHFTRRIIEQFFRLRLGQGGLLRLQQVQPSQSPQTIEERRLIYSKVNKNPKIEVNGARILVDNYPTGEKRPIVIFAEVGPSFYRYMILLPSESGYERLSHKLDIQPKEGAALNSWITDLDSLLEVWDEYPH